MLRHSSQKRISLIINSCSNSWLWSSWPSGSGFSFQAPLFRTIIFLLHFLCTFMTLELLVSRTGLLCSGAPLQNHHFPVTIPYNIHQCSSSWPSGPDFHSAISLQNYHFLIRSVSSANLDRLGSRSILGLLASKSRFPNLARLLKPTTGSLQFLIKVIMLKLLPLKIRFLCSGTPFQNHPCLIIIPDQIHLFGFPFHQDQVSMFWQPSP